MISVNEIIGRELKPRSLLDEVIRWLDRPEAIVIVGPRQVGKTSLMFLIARHIIENRLGNVFFYDLEMVSDKALLADPESLLALPERSFVFIDEVQYHPEAARLIKLTVDHARGVKLIVSGSSSAKIFRETGDKLVGRRVEFRLYPLSFKEFLMFKDRADLVSLLESPSEPGFEPFQRLFLEFLVYGGMPAVVLEPQVDRKVKLLEELFSAYMFKDVVPLFGLRRPDKFTSLLKLLAARVGGLLNMSSISDDIDLSRPTVESYIKILEMTFVIDTVPPFFRNPRKEVIKMRKGYFFDTGFRNWALRRFDMDWMREDIGHLVENYVLMELRKAGVGDVRYWQAKTGVEVDFIVNGLPIEVKFRRFNRPKVSRGMASFIRRYKPPKALVITKNLSGEMEFNGTQVFFVPAFRFSRSIQWVMHFA